MESSRGNPQNQKDAAIAKSQDASYPVTLRRPVIDYFAQQLTPRFDQEKLAIQQRDGSYQELMEFVTNSPFGGLMQRLREQPADPNAIPRESVVALSAGDIALIKNKSTHPSVNDYVGFKVHGEMMDELTTNFGSAKSNAQIKNAVNRIRGLVKRK